MKRNTDNVIFKILAIAFCVLIISLTVGYAFSDKILDLNGNVTVKKFGKLRIKSITIDTSQQNTLPSNSGQGLILNNDGTLGLDFNFTVSREDNTYYVTYLIELENGSQEVYNFTGFNLSPEVTVSGNSSSNAGAFITHQYVNTPNSNLSINDKLYPDETKKFAVKLSIRVVSEANNTTIGVGGGASVGASTDNTGTFYGHLVDTNIDLKNQNLDCFSFEVMNTHLTEKSFTVTSANTNFSFVDTNGNALSTFTISAPSDEDDENVQTFSACVVKSPTAIFNTENQTTGVVISATGLSPLNIGTLNVLVAQSEEVDTTPLSIGNVSFSRKIYDIDNSSLITTVSWSRLDTGGTSVDKYVLQLFDSTSGSSSPVGTFEVDGNTPTTNYELVLNSSFLNTNKTNMVTNDHSYYIKIYGIDQAGNSGLSYCNQSNSAYCVSSAATSLKYEFNITVTSTTANNGTNRVRLSGNSTSKKIYYKAAFSDTISVSTNGYSLNGSVTVTTNNTTWTNSTEYFFGLASGSSTSGNISIYEGYVEDDVTVVTPVSYTDFTCLAEGSKIRLANGSVKNIEDITYEDLIVAYSHDIGKIVEEYPIWVEEAGYSDDYQMNTFSDGSVLKTVGQHGIFSVDKMQYVSVMDPDSFHIGTRVVKINDNNEMEIVQVTGIEKIEEPVRFYHVSSTYYHNVVADNMLTTDSILIVSNMFPFNDDLTWTSEREDFINNNILFRYEDWAHVFPEHIFKGFRMREAMILQIKGILDISLFDRILNGRIVEPKKSENGKYMWMVSTSDNTEGVYYEANSYYTLPEPNEVEGKTFKGWYNNADNNMYQVGDEVEIIYGMHFIAIWE